MAKEHDSTEARTTHTSLHVQGDERSSRRPVLIALHGPNPGAVHRIPGEVVLGRSNEASLSVDDDRVSRRHTRIIGSSISSTRTPHTTPVMRVVLGFRCAPAKNY